MVVDFCSASEAVYLNLQNTSGYNVPESTKDRLNRIDQENTNNSIEDDIDGEDFYSDEEVFDTNVGKIFSNFVDKKFINNKYSNIPNKIKTLKY